MKGVASQNVFSEHQSLRLLLFFKAWARQTLYLFLCLFYLNNCMCDNHGWWFSGPSLICSWYTNQNIVMSCWTTLTSAKLKGWIINRWQANCVWGLNFPWLYQADLNSMTFPWLFQAGLNSMTFPWLFQEGLNSMTFPVLYEPCKPFVMMGSYIFLHWTSLRMVS